MSARGRWHLENIKQNAKRLQRTQGTSWQRPGRMQKNMGIRNQYGNMHKLAMRLSRCSCYSYYDCEYIISTLEDYGISEREIQEVIEDYEHGGNKLSGMLMGIELMGLI